MSVNWSWDAKIGEIAVKQTFADAEYDYTISIYAGNCMAVLLHEFKNNNGEDMYDFYGFFNDKTHAKRCLGLSKSMDGAKVNIYPDWVSLTILKEDKQLEELAMLCLKAFPHFTIINNIA